MLVVADTTPLHTLVEIECVDILPQLFRRIAIPPAVAKELRNPNAPEVVLAFMSNLPSWLEIRQPDITDPIPGIDPGEQAAIALARQLGADRLLIDDLEGRRAALERKVRVIGTVGVLVRAAVDGLVDLEVVFSRLQQTGFHYTEELLTKAREEYARALKAKRKHR